MLKEQTWECVYVHKMDFRNSKKLHLCDFIQKSKDPPETVD